MVLSNKKLKQKLRAELTQTQSNSNVAEPDAPSSSSNSLKLLLDSAAHKPILTKREKRRKLRPLQQPHPLPSEPADEDKGTNKENGTEGSDKKKKENKKRKRKVENQNQNQNQNQNDDVANDGVLKDTNQSNKKKQKKKKKKKQKPKKNKAKPTEENGSNHEGEISESTVLTKTNTNTNISQENGDVPTRVYVGGIPYYSTEDDIRSYFEGCGTITEVDCMYFPESGKFRGIAIISFKTEAAAKRALALDGADMGGLFLKIQPYKATHAARFAPEMLEGYNRIYVGNLSWEITEEELKKFFSKCNITSIRFGMDKETGEFRGYAHVDFSDSQSLKTALTLDQGALFGRPVRISCAVPLKKKPGAGVKSDAAEKPGKKPSPPVNSKMKNRMCYGCREKGHSLSECPNKQTDVSATI